MLTAVFILSWSWGLSSANGFVLHEEPLEEKSTEIGILARTFSFLMAGTILEQPYSTSDANPMGVGLFDLRLSFSHRSPSWKLVLHNQLSTQLRTQVLSSPLALGRGQEPLRLLPLQAELAQNEGLSILNTLDWAYLALNWGPMSATLGRQPITFGRGKLFAPLDLISSFALTEVDTEYKPGADGMRLDFTLSEKTVLTAVAVAGKWDDALSWRGSSLALRCKQGWSSGEAGVTAGYVRRDGVLGIDGVYDAGSFDLYGETTLTLVTADSLTPRQPRTRRVVVRGLAGATFKPLAKLTLSPEVYFNDFGAWSLEDYFQVALSERVAIGEQSTLGKLYLGLTSLWEAHPLLQVALVSLANLRDPSGLLSLGLTYNAAANVDLVAGFYLPLGRIPDLRSGALPRPRGEFGLYPTLVFIEIKVAL